MRSIFKDYSIAVLGIILSICITIVIEHLQVKPEQTPIPEGMALYRVKYLSDGALGIVQLFDGFVTGDTIRVNTTDKFSHDIEPAVVQPWGGRTDNSDSTQ